MMFNSVNVHGATGAKFTAVPRYTWVSLLSGGEDTNVGLFFLGSNRADDLQAIADAFAEAAAATRAVVAAEVAESAAAFGTA